MAKKHDITSTERLLERIRQDQSGERKSSFAGRVAPEPLVAASSPEGAPRTSSSVGKSGEPVTDKSVKKRKQPQALFSRYNRKSGTVGVELKVDGIGLALVQSSGKRVGYSEVRFIPYETEVFKDEETLLADLLNAQWFPSFLQKQLHDFCGSVKKISIWCGLPMESVKVHNVTIPKVPDNEIASSVFWSMQKVESFDRDEIILDFDLIKEIEEDSFTRLLAIVYMVRRPEVEKLEELFRKTGFRLTGISTPTVSLQNEIRCGHFSCEDESFSRLVIGENKSFIEIYFRNILVFSRDIKTGIASFIDSLMEMAASRGVILSEEQCRKLIVAEDRETAALAGGYGLFTDGETDIFSLDLPAPVRLIRQMERTFDFYQNNYQIPRCSSIHLSGVSSGDTGLAGYLSSEIGIPCYVHDPFASLVRPLTISRTDSVGGGYRLAPSFDLALSDPDETRNFLLPRTVREKQAQEERVNKIAVFCTSVLLVTCAIIFFWQNTQIQDKQVRLQGVNSVLSRGMFTDENQANTLLNNDLGRLKENSRLLIALGERYLPSALLGQITVCLPAEIKLLSLGLDDQKISAAKKSEEEGVRRVTLEGFVTGNRHNMEFILARYVRKLSQSSFIVSAIVLEKTTDIYMSRDVLSFTVQLKAAIDETKLFEKEKV